jgi:dipeptidyl-peptidase 4
MRKICFYAIALFLLYPATSIGQLEQLNLQSAVLGQYSQFYPANLYGLTWHPGSGECLYFSDRNTISEIDISSLLRKQLLSLSTLNESLLLHGSLPLKKLPSFVMPDADHLYFIDRARVIRYTISTKKIEFDCITDSISDNPDFSIEASAIAYTIDNNLFIKKVNSESIQVTQDKDRSVVNGQIVSRNEFGIDKGTFWSPKGNFLAFYRKDESHVSSYPIVNTTTRIATVNEVKYPMAGMASERVSLGVYNLTTAKTIYIEQDTASEKYLTSVSWSPDEATIYIALLNRGQDTLRLNRYDAQTGKLLNTLFTETSSSYVEPLNPLYFIPNSSSEFIWVSERDGYTHLYLYTKDGILVKQLTAGPWNVVSITGMDPDGESVFFTSTIKSPLERQLVRVHIKSGKLQVLTSESGTHLGVLSPDGKFVIDEFESTTIPRKISVINNSGKSINDLLLAPNPLNKYSLGKVTIGTLLTKDQKTTLYFRYTTPPDFNPSKKYPVIVYVYGGPHAQLITNTWTGGASLWESYMAQKGYIVFTLDNRGSANRGFEFESCIHRQVGRLEMEDQMQGINWLQSQAWVDTSRIGIHGWSYGGFMTLSLMTSYPRIFKVGVAGGPVTDWKYYEVMYGERYMDKPQENPLGYAENSLLTKAKNLQGKLLIIHGALDVTVVWQQSLAFIQACIEDKKQVDYFVYPQHEHNVRGPDRVHLMEKVTDYFDTYLK